MIPLIWMFFFEEIPCSIEKSANMDKIRWSSDTIKLNYSYTTFQDEVAYLKYYFEGRYELVKEYLYENDSYCTVTFVDQLNRCKKYFVRQGEMIPNSILGFISGQCKCDAWCYDIGRNYSPTRPVFSDIILYAKSNETIN